MPETRVTMYSRRTCGLCDRAREVILSVGDELRFDFEEVFLDDAPQLESEYGLRVPVVLLDGVERFEVEVAAEELREAVQARGA